MFSIFSSLLIVRENRNAEPEILKRKIAVQRTNVIANVNARLPFDSFLFTPFRAHNFIASRVAPRLRIRIDTSQPSPTRLGKRLREEPNKNSVLFFNVNDNWTAPAR